nr:TlpA family protein disulfide reductase [Bacteroidaceae bacterium]
NELKGKYAVINVWASWNFDSQSIQRQIQSLKRQFGNKLTVLSINMDVSKTACQEVLNRDSIRWNNICDEKAWNSPLVNTFGISTVPDNFIVSPDGRIVARNLDMTALKERVETLLK